MNGVSALIKETRENSLTPPTTRTQQKARAVNQEEGLIHHAGILSSHVRPRGREQVWTCLDSPSYLTQSGWVKTLGWKEPSPRTGQALHCY